MTPEEIAKKIATEIVCEGCVTIMTVMSEHCIADPCATWYEAYEASLKAYKAGYDDAVKVLEDART